MSGVNQGFPYYVKIARKRSKRYHPKVLTDFTPGDPAGRAEDKAASSTQG
jgi:hypothetical protein